MIDEQQMRNPTRALPETISYGRRITQLAARHPDKAAIIFVPIEGPERQVAWRELDERSTQIARQLQEHGVDARSTVVIGLRNCPEIYFVAYAAWKLGALVLPLRWQLPPRERDQLLELAQPRVVVAEWEGIAAPQLTLDDLRASAGYSVQPLPDVIAEPGYAIGSGGSTGRSKIIVLPGAMARTPDERPWVVGYRPGQTQLVGGPLYHNSPMGCSTMGLFDDHTIVLLEKFDAARAVDLIERHRVNWGFFPPTMLKRMHDLPDVRQRDFSSIDAIFQTAAPCPAWLKRFWIELLGPEKVYEGFGSAEAVGHTGITGTEWLEHPGSVGRPEGTDLKILDEDFNELPTGEVGEIFMRYTDRSGPTYAYIGAPPAKTSPEGYISVGDLGWVDEAGYLYLADRRVDMIVTGGANVYPAEVEGALLEHPEVDDLAVVGVPDEDWGKRVHAIVQPRDAANPPAVAHLDAFVRERLASYKVPKSYEYCASLPRNDAGKIRRSELAAERAAGWTPAMLPARD
jgi:bile acid-coenzyme A ligase